MSGPDTYMSCVEKFQSSAELHCSSVRRLLQGSHQLGSMQVAALIGADPKEIIFTSGATESNNLALKGVANFYKGKKKHIITTQTDHKCVLDSARYLSQRGFEVTYLPVKSDGLLDLQLLEQAIRPDTAIVSVMMVNNEIGAHFISFL